jgi:hypothetical protein
MPWDCGDNGITVPLYWSFVIPLLLLTRAAHIGNQSGDKKSAWGKQGTCSRPVAVLAIRSVSRLSLH